MAIKNNMNKVYAARSQRIQFYQDLHYQKVVEVGMDKAQQETRKKRIDILLERGIRKGVEVVAHNGEKLPVCAIQMNGMLLLENFDEIDPLTMQGGHHE